MKEVINFVVEKPTKNTVRFKEVDANGNDVGLIAKIGTLYIKKSALPTEIPARLTVTVEA